jgi:serine/threonine-protein kinase
MAMRDVLAGARHVEANHFEADAKRRFELEAPALTPNRAPKDKPREPTAVSRPAPAPPPPPVTKKPNPCDPPYTVDSQGHRKYKLECLK